MKITVLLVVIRVLRTVPEPRKKTGNQGKSRDHPADSITENI